ncbi:unnamed protein product [Moneuplotes crassus]|uniref:Uncharacterized protein n=1 Tax=Euplotes crassus TaxID=5936 RepID=A0AAD1UM62_EUPCR|nr:unnamed protein product [Moneuplotes crassus]
MADVGDLLVFSLCELIYFCITELCRGKCGFVNIIPLLISITMVINLVSLCFSNMIKFICCFSVVRKKLVLKCFCFWKEHSSQCCLHSTSTKSATTDGKVANTLLSPVDENPAQGE